MIGDNTLKFLSLHVADQNILPAAINYLCFMIIGILKEPSFESRVSLLAAEAAALTKNGFTVWVEPDAG